MRLQELHFQDLSILKEHLETLSKTFNCYQDICTYFSIPENCWNLDIVQEWDVDIYDSQADVVVSDFWDWCFDDNSIPHIGYIYIWMLGQLAKHGLEMPQKITLLEPYSLQEIPKEVQYLTSLEEIDLSDCPELTELPKELARLGPLRMNLDTSVRSLTENIEEITITEQNLSLLEDCPHFAKIKSINILGATTFPYTIFKCQQLEHLYIDHYIEKMLQVPKECNQLRHLKSLTLDCIRCDAQLLDLRNIPNLESLEILNCQSAVLPTGEAHNIKNLFLQGALPPFPSSLLSNPELESCEIIEGKLELLPDWTKPYPKLTKVDLSWNKLKSLPKGWNNVPNLQEFSCCGNEITQIPDSLASCVELESMDFSQNPLEETPTWICDLPKVTRLHLSELPVREDLHIPDHITDIDLEGCKLSTLPSSILSLQTLKSLSLKNNLFTTVPESLLSLVQDHLNISENPLTDETIAWLLERDALPKIIFDNWSTNDEKYAQKIAALLQHEDQSIVASGLMLLESIMTMRGDQSPNLKRYGLDTSKNEHGFRKYVEEVPHGEHIWLWSAMREALSLFWDSITAPRLEGFPSIPKKLWLNPKSMDMSGGKLSSLPDDFQRFTKLESLELSHQQFEEVPLSITKLPNLTALYMGGNPLSTLPKELIHLKLTSLSLDMCQCTSIPDVLFELNTLETLNLERNKITSFSVPSHLSPSWKVLNLRSNQITTICESISRMTELEELDLCWNFDLSTVPQSIVTLSKLQILRIGHTPLAYIISQKMQLPSVTKVITSKTTQKADFHTSIPLSFPNAVVEYL